MTSNSHRSNRAPRFLSRRIGIIETESAGYRAVGKEFFSKASSFVGLQKGYHWHRGPLAGQSFQSKDEMLHRHRIMPYAKSHLLLLGVCVVALVIISEIENVSGWSMAVDA